jgi:hypothetical protein
MPAGPAQASSNCPRSIKKESGETSKKESGEIFPYRIQRNSPPPSGAFHPFHPILKIPHEKTP